MKKLEIEDIEEIRSSRCVIKQNSRPHDVPNFTFICDVNVAAIFLYPFIIFL